jgi:hypothetical protein
MILVKAKSFKNHASRQFVEYGLAVSVFPDVGLIKSHRKVDGLNMLGELPD